MTTYNKYITEEGKNEVLKIAFSSEMGENTFRYLALGTNNGGSLASQTGNKTDFIEISGNGYQRISIDNNTVDFDNNGSATLSFTVDEDNYNTTDGIEIREIALCNDFENEISDDMCKVFAFCEVPAIEKTGNISLKYTLKINIE